MSEQDERKSTHYKHHHGGWTPERVELLTQMWAAGKSASICAEALGQGATRNCVIGKSHRLGLPSHGPNVQRSPPRPKKPPAPRKQAQRAPRLLIVRPPVIKAERPPQPLGDAWLALEATVPVSLVDLGHGQCKWPIGGDSPFTFCGAQAVEGKPYCEHHRLWSVGRGTDSERDAVRSGKWVAERENVAEVA